MQARDAHKEVTATAEAHLPARRAEHEVAKRLAASAKSSAAVARRLAEEGTAVEVCSLAQVFEITVSITSARAILFPFLILSLITLAAAK